jgi:hypothetical protein
VRRSYGPRVDAETGQLHARVAQAHDYQLVTVLWRRRVGNGAIECQFLRSTSGPAKRLVQLHATWSDAGVPTTAVCQVHSPEEEARDAMRLEHMILAASRRPEELHVIERRK